MMWYWVWESWLCVLWLMLQSGAEAVAISSTFNAPDDQLGNDVNIDFNTSILYEVEGEALVSHAGECMLIH